jgi:hypothetical protein
MNLTPGALQPRINFVQHSGDPQPLGPRKFAIRNSQQVPLGVFFSCFKPSSPRWFLFPGPLGRGFFYVRLLSVGIAGMCLLAGCGSVSVEEYESKTPAFEPEAFFSGFLTAHGVVKDYKGRAIRHFSADINACWQEGVGTLDEQFVFDDGERQKRIWTLKPRGTGNYAATAGDVIGEGTATWRGNAFFLDYVLQLELESGPFSVRIDDRMYRVADHIVINESKMKKWGFTVGEILLTIIRHPERSGLCATD